MCIGAVEKYLVAYYSLLEIKLNFFFIIIDTYFYGLKSFFVHKNMYNDLSLNVDLTQNTLH